MSRTLRFPLAAGAILALATAGPAPSKATAAPAPPVGKNITLPYPAKAPVIVQINGLERIRERLAQTLKALPPAEADKLKKELDGGLDQLLKDRQLTAVPKDGRMFVVLHDITTIIGDEPAISVLVPVTSYKEFRDSFLTADERKGFEAGKDGVDSVKTTAFGDERTLYLVDRKEHVVVTADKGTAEVYTGKFTPAMSGGMGPDISNSFLTADVALYVNMDVINDLYGDNIRQFKGLIDFALMQAQQGGMLPGVNKKQLEMIKVVLQGMFQAVEDSKGLLVAAELRPDGVNFRVQVRFADDTPSAKMLKSESPGPLADIAALPRGMSGYSGMRLGKTFNDLMRQFGQEFAGADDDEAVNGQIDKLLKELAAAGPQGEFSASSATETTLGVTAYTNAKNAAATYVKLYQALPAGARVNSIILKEKPKVTEKAKTLNGFTFTEVRLAFDFEATVKDFPDNLRESALQQFKRSAKEKTTLWVGTDGKVVVRLQAKDWESAAKVMEEYLDGKTVVGSDAAFQTTRKNLPADANLIMLFETGQLIEALVEQAQAAGGQIPGFPQIGGVKPVKGDPTFVGAALTLKPEVVTLDVFVPGTGLNVAARMLAPLFKNFE